MARKEVYMMVSKAFHEYFVIIWEIKCFILWVTLMWCVQIPIGALVSVDTDGREQQREGLALVSWINKRTHKCSFMDYILVRWMWSSKYSLYIVYPYHVEWSLFWRHNTHHGGAAMIDFERRCPDWRRVPTWPKWSKLIGRNKHSQTESWIYLAETPILN